MLTTAQIASLRTELSQDPKGLGFAALLAAGDDAGVAAALNSVPVAPAVPADWKVNRPFVSGAELFEAIDPSEWTATAPLAHLKQAVQMVVSTGNVNVNGTNTKAAMLAAFPAGGPTRTNLVALLTRIGSRAEVLFGFGVVVSVPDVANAR